MKLVKYTCSWVSIVYADDLVLQHQDISIHNADLHQSMPLLGVSGC